MAQDVVVTPQRWTSRGEAEAGLNGKPLRVWSGIPGERAGVHVVHEGQHAAFGVYRGTVTPHPHRVEPRCSKYHTCGGCPLMHLDAEGQRQARADMVRDAFRTEGLHDIEVGEVVPSPDGEDGFRWVVKLGVGYSDHKRLRVGAWGRRSRSVVPIPDCTVAAPPVLAAMTAVAHHIIDLNIPPYDDERDEGVLRAIVIRGSRSTGEVVVTLVAGERKRSLNDLAERLMSEAAEISGVALHLNDQPGNAIYSRDEEGAVRSTELSGRGWMEDTLNGITYRISPGDFFQTNPGMAEVLYADTLDRLGLDKDVPFVDLYCGVGGLALPAARRTGWALGVEEIVGAVDQARNAAKHQGIPAEFMSGRVEELLPQLARRLSKSRPVVAVNPARRGLEAGVVDAIIALQPRRIAYISCNPQALARDLVAFRDRGMRTTSIQLYDMFPNTAHVECVAVLEAEDAEEAARRAPRRKVVGAKRSRSE